MSKTKVIEVPLRDRDFIFTDAELAGYLGLKTIDTLIKDYIGMHIPPERRIHKTPDERVQRKCYSKKKVIEYMENGGWWKWDEKGNRIKV